MKNRKQSNIRLYLIICMMLFSMIGVQVEGSLNQVSYASEIILSNYDHVYDVYKDANGVDDAYKIIEEANFRNFTDENIYQLLALTYAKKDWQESEKISDLEKLRILIAKKGAWLNRFADKKLVDKDTPKAHYQLMYKWPDNFGFIEGTETVKALAVGKEIDRYGYPHGGFLSPIGTSYEARALTPGTKETRPYFIYKVIKTFDVKSGNIQPWFGVGDAKAIQYQLIDHDVQYYLDNGYLKVVPQSK